MKRIGERRSPKVLDARRATCALERCRADGPNVTGSGIMREWIRAYSVPFRDTIWTILALKECRVNSRRSFAWDIADICSSDGIGLDDDTVSATIKERLGSVSEKPCYLEDYCFSDKKRLNNSLVGLKTRSLA